MTYERDVTESKVWFTSNLNFFNTAMYGFDFDAVRLVYYVYAGEGSGATVTVTWPPVRLHNPATGELYTYRPGGSRAYSLTGPQTCSGTEGSDKCDPKPDQVNNPKSPEETGPLKCGTFADPCDAYNGNYFHQERDLSLGGLIPLHVARAYYSGKSAFVGDFGVGSHLENYNYSLDIPKDSNNHVVLAPNTKIKFNTGNDSFLNFKNLSGGNVFTNNALLGTTGDNITLSVAPDGTLTEATYHNLNGKIMHFNANGWLTATVDRNGNQVTFTRDAQGKLQQVTEASTGRYIQFAYNSDGLISQATDSTGRTVSYTYSSAKELLTVINPASQTMNYTWDDQHRIVSKTDFNGTSKMTNEYGPTGAVTKQVQADGGEIKLEAFSDTVRKVTDPNGHVTTYRYNEQGLVTEVEDALGHKLKTRYAPNVFTDNTASRFVESEDPLGRVHHVDLNAMNLPTAMVDTLGQQIRMEYDSLHPDKVKKIIDAKGHVTQLAYDVKGNLITRTDNAGNNTTFTYNPKGQVLTVTNALGHVTRFSYNTQNDLVSVTDSVGNKTLYEYDNLSRLAKITDPKGNMTTMVYDVLNRMISTTDALNNIKTYAYDANGNLISKTDAKGNTTTFSYDAKDRLISSTNAKGETYSYQYDGTDNLVSMTDPKGQVITNDHDAANRVTGMMFGDGVEYSYTYDPASQMVSVNNGEGTWDFTYDLLGRVTVATSPEGAVNYTYDTNGNVTQLSSPGYGTASYTYDEMDRLSSISKDGKTYSYEYDALGRRTGLNRPNAVESSYEYDAASRLISLTHSKGTKVLEKHDYAYDKNGNIVQYTRGDGVMKPYMKKHHGKRGWCFSRQIMGYVADKADEIERSYTYDALNRLTSVNGLGMLPGASKFKNSGNRLAAALLIEQARRVNNPQMRNHILRNAERLGAVLPESASWQFDPNGNIVKKILKTTDGDKAITYTYDESDRLVSLTRPLDTDNDDGRPCPFHWRYHSKKNGHKHPFGRPGQYNLTPQTETITLDYDSNGNLTSDSTGRVFSWNGINLLTRLQTEDMTTVFNYDPLGRRTDFTQGVHSKSYLYDGLDALTNGISKYLFGPGMDDPLQMESPTKNISYLQDQIGSISQTVSPTGQTSKRYEYKSYGKLEGDINNPDLENSFTFNGREDDGTGLYYYRARYYDPELEIFISQDPLGDGYRFVGNNPMRFIDPLGLAYFAKKNLEGLPYIPGISQGEGGLNTNDTELSHEHLFFEDGKNPSNAGFSPGGTFNNANIKDYQYKDPQHYNDCLMRKAYDQLKKQYPGSKYNWYFNNCQDFASELRKKYSELLKNPAASQNCGVN